MKFKEINPVFTYRYLVKSFQERKLYEKYKQIIFELNQSELLNEHGFMVDRDANLYLGINLNPELLAYAETSQESVELRMIGEKMKKYNDFLTREGILDSVKVDYERILNNDFYGYVLKISFNFKTYERKKFNSGVVYLVSLLGLGICSFAGLGFFILKNI